jgi:transposase-like protein
MCHHCARLYTPDPLPLSYSDEVRREAVRLYLEGINFRRIGRILGVNHQSVINWVDSYHSALPAAEQPVSRPETLEMDELFTFVGSKKRKPTS